MTGALLDQASRFAAGFEGYCREAGRFVDDCCAMLEQRLGLEEGQISQAADRQITLAAEHIEGKLAPDLLNHSFQYLTKPGPVGRVSVYYFYRGDSADAGL